MSTIEKHSDLESSNFFEKVELPFEKSKEEIWDIISDKIDEPVVESPKVKVISLSWVKIMAAAMVFLLVGTTSFLRFYSIGINNPRGAHLSHILPDGSMVELNAESSLSYHPYWWSFKRELIFEGEAFFEVEKGQRFSIISKNGITEVLGTSFNVFARDANYKVFCKTGRVRVSSTKSNVEMVINPGEMAVINNQLKQGQVQNIKEEQIIGWKSNKFSFTSEPLQMVINELERQYNVNIHMQKNIPSDLIYTGLFTKSTSVESSLNFICKSFNLNFTQDKKEGYIITQK